MLSHFCLRLFFYVMLTILEIKLKRHSLFLEYYLFDKLSECSYFAGFHNINNILFYFLVFLMIFIKTMPYKENIAIYGQITTFLTELKEKKLKKSN